MQASITVKAWSVGVYEPLTTTPVNTMKCWLRPVDSNHATGNAPPIWPPGGFVSDTVIVGAFDPWAHVDAVIVTW